MRLNFTEVLSDDEIAFIHEASVNILSETGVRVLSSKALDMLERAGAKVERTSKIVRFPAEMIKLYTEDLKDKIRLYNRSQDKFITLGDGRVYVAAGHNAIYIQELESSNIRNATKKDVGEFALLTDALDNLEIAGIVLMPDDVCKKASLVHAVDAMFNNTAKHIFFSPGTMEETAAILDIARAVTGSDDLSEKPVLTCQVSPTSPLTWEPGAVDALILVAEAGVPVVILPGPMGGAACPYTLAGHFIQYNVEMLSGIIISQVAKKGAPVIYGGGWSIFDMKECIAKIASPETALLRIAGIQMSRFYGIPNHSMGLDSDSHCYDEQQGMEKMLTGMVDFAAGCDFIVNAGMYSSGVTASLEQLVIDDEISGILYRLIEGMDFSPDKAAVDIIKETGLSGEYLSSEHTVKYLRSGEHREEELSSRYSLRKWREKGKPDIIAKAAQKVRNIMLSHKVEPLSDEIKQKIQKIITQFEGLYA